MHRVLRDAGLKWPEITRVLLTGGSSRMPMVRQMVEKESGRHIDRSVSVDEAVAHGAAVYAGMVLAREAGERPQVSVSNVNSHDLGVLGIEPGTGRPRRKVLIPRNSSLPATHGSRFVTHAENQRTVAVPVIEGGDASGHNSTAIGKCVVKGLPKQLPKGTTVVVNFTYTQSGRLTVSATLPDIQNASASMTIERASGLSDEEIQSWQARIAAGLHIGVAAAEDAEAPATNAVPKAVPIAPVKVRPVAVADDADEGHAEDADATIWEDSDTVEEASAAAELLAKIKNAPAEKPKNQDKPKPAKKDESIRLDGLPSTDEPKIDPDDDNALGDFLRGTQ
jgi:molecular chaperone DnaK